MAPHFGTNLNSLRQNNQDLAQRLNTVQVQLRTSRNRIRVLEKKLILQEIKLKCVTRYLLQMADQLHPFLDIVDQALHTCANEDDFDKQHPENPPASINSSDEDNQHLKMTSIAEESTESSLGLHICGNLESQVSLPCINASDNATRSDYTIGRYYARLQEEKTKTKVLHKKHEMSDYSDIYSSSDAHKTVLKRLEEKGEAVFLDTASELQDPSLITTKRILRDIELNATAGKAQAENVPKDTYGHLKFSKEVVQTQGTPLNNLEFLLSSKVNLSKHEDSAETINSRCTNISPDKEDYRKIQENSVWMDLKSFKTVNETVNRPMEATKLGTPLSDTDCENAHARTVQTCTRKPLMDINNFVTFGMHLVNLKPPSRKSFPQTDKIKESIDERENSKKDQVTSLTAPRRQTSNAKHYKEPSLKTKMRQEDWLSKT